MGQESKDENLIKRIKQKQDYLKNIHLSRIKIKLKRIRPDPDNRD